jgi:RNA polymerase sigma factor, sigma-70 family
MKVFNPSGVNHVERMNAAETAWLIRECIAGNEDAIEIFVRRHEVDVFRLALSIVGDQAEADEITQETFLSALRSLRSYQEKNSLKAWLYTIALNHSRSHIRKRKILEKLRSAVTTVFQFEHSHKQPSPENAVILNETESALWAELNKLDEAHRTVVILRYFHELPVAEISEILTVNEGTIHSRLHNARKRLKSQLEKLHGE